MRSYLFCLCVCHLKIIFCICICMCICNFVFLEGGGKQGKKNFGFLDDILEGGEQKCEVNRDSINTYLLYLL